MARTCTSCGAGFFGAAGERGWTCKHCGCEHPPDAAADTVFLGNAPPTPKPWEVPEPGPRQPVTSDLPCLQCGYNLNGLSSDLACPECGRRVAESMKGDLLDFAGEAELSRLYRGVVLVQAALLLGVVLGVVAGLLAGVMGAIVGGLPGWAVSAMVVIGPLAALLLTLQLVLGWWWISEPDPARAEGPPEGDPGRRERAALRTSLVVIAGLGVVSFGLGFVPPYATAMASLGVHPLPTVLGANTLIGGVTPTVGGWGVAYTIVETVRALGEIAIAVTSMLYLRRLAPRVPSKALARMALRMAWLVPLLSTFGVLLCGLGPIVALLLKAMTLEMLRSPLGEIRRRRREAEETRVMIERELA